MSFEDSDQQQQQQQQQHNSDDIVDSQQPGDYVHRGNSVAGGGATAGSIASAGGSFSSSSHNNSSQNNHNSNTFNDNLNHSSNGASTTLLDQGRGHVVAAGASGGTINSSYTTVSSDNGKHKSSLKSGSSFAAGGAAGAGGDAYSDVFDFDIPLGRNSQRARTALLEASDDALGVHRRTFIRRMQMVFNIVVFLAVIGVLAFLAQQVLSISDMVASQLAEVSVVRTTADGEPIAAGAVVSYTAGGVRQGHGPSVGNAMTSLPCDGGQRVFFGANASTSVVSAAMASGLGGLTYWSVNSSLDHQSVDNVSLNASAAENSGAATHSALAGAGNGDPSSGLFLVISGAKEGSSSVFVHVIDSATGEGYSKTLAAYFTATTSDRSGAFAVPVPQRLSPTLSGAVVGYPCGDGVCCVDLVSWGGDVVITGPRLSIPRCPAHAVLHDHQTAHDSSTASAATKVAEDSLVLVLPTLPVIAMTVNATNSSITVAQVLRLPVSTLSGVGNSSDASVRVASIPSAHKERSLLVAVGLHDVMLLYQMKLVKPTTSGSSSSSAVFVIVPQLYAAVRTGLAGPMAMTGLVFASAQSWASLHFTDANKLHYLVQVSFASSIVTSSAAASAAAGGEVSVPTALPAAGAAALEFLLLSDAWRNTAMVLRDSDKFCSLRTVEWQGGINFAGVAAGGAQAGQSVDVLTGGIVRVYANLVPGSLYSAGVNGSMVPVYDPLALAASSKAAIGRAFSATELYLFPSR